MEFDKRLGFVGLGKMGNNIVLQLLEKGYKVVVYNRTQEKMAETVEAGAIPSRSMGDLVSKLPGERRVVWMMLPEDVTFENVLELAKSLHKGDIIIDGSNSNYKESKELYQALKKYGVKYLDAGCSGGPSGARNGMCIMVGGDREDFFYLRQLFEDTSVKDGLFFTGQAGSGHYVKMVHNGIEYGMMQSIGEGLELLKNGPFKGLDLSNICKLWDHGSVIEGKLIRLAGHGLEKDSSLKGIAPYVEDTGEGRWCVETGIEFRIPVPSMSLALFERFKSRSEEKFQDRTLAMMRNEFGGHVTKPDKVKTSGG
jgi:6-phosphogluconate dehydrogenase